MKRVCVIYNPFAGSAPWIHELKEEFNQQQLNAVFVPVQADLSKQINKFIKQGIDTFVAAGGDGTIHSAVQELVDTNCKLGVLPVGTLNHFAKDLSIPIDVKAAIAVIAKGRTEKVDVAEVNGQAFVNNSSIGIYPHIVRTRRLFHAFIGKWPALISASLFVLLRPPRYRLNLVVDGKKVSCTSPFVFVGNNSYKISKTGFTNRASLNSGLLSIYVVRSDSRKKILQLFFKAMLGVANSDQNFSQYHVPALTIHSRRPRISVSLDGEVKRLKTPLKYSLKPQSLNVII